MTGASPEKGVGPFSHPANESLCSTADLQAMLQRFAVWLESTGYEGYDPYDIWGTRYGLWARRLYYSKHPLGAAVTGPLILIEVLCPWLRKTMVAKARSATADAQLILAFLNLSESCGSRDLPASPQFAENGGRRAEIRLFGDRASGDNELRGNSPQAAIYWLAKAKELAEELLNYSTPGYAGYCWGYPFDWRHANGLWPRGTPFITATPYCFEAFLRLFDITGESNYGDIARSIADFVANDIIDMPAGSESSAASYGPFASAKVINASAYRAYVLFEAASRFKIETYAVKAWKNLRFIMQSQRADGAWLYAVETTKEDFIDHFHTCFVLKNLCKINRRLKDHKLAETIEKGYSYYRRELFYGNSQPRPFAKQRRLRIVRLEMYDVAEAITLGVLLRDITRDGLRMASHLARLVRDKYQLPQGYFVTRVYTGGIRHRFPFLRWPQAQLFYALSNLLCASSTQPA